MFLDHWCHPHRIGPPHRRVSFWYFGSTNYHLTGVPVLNYHQVNNKFNTVLTMKPADFEEQIKYLHDNDYHAITLEQFDAYMRGEGRFARPANPHYL